MNEKTNQDQTEAKPEGANAPELLPAVSGCKILNKYAVAATLIKDIYKGSLNIMVDLRKIEAISKEEALGKYILEVSEQITEYHIHVRPVVMDI